MLFQWLLLNLINCKNLWACSRWRCTCPWAGWRRRACYSPRAATQARLQAPGCTLPPGTPAGWAAVPSPSGSWSAPPTRGGQCSAVNIEKLFFLKERLWEIDQVSQTSGMSMSADLHAEQDCKKWRRIVHQGSWRWAHHPQQWGNDKRWRLQRDIEEKIIRLYWIC